MLGAAVSTAVPAAGAVCPRIVPGVGAACTQSWTNPYLAIDALARVQDGEAAGATLDGVLAGDAAREVRQIGIADAAGRSAAFSGAACTDWFGHVTGPGDAIQGNMLAGPGVIASMEKAFVASAAAELAERMLLALEAAQAARAADEAVRAGHPLGRLHGVPIGIKDNYLTADMPTTAGTKAPGANFPMRDSAVAARLRAAGAILAGKTRTHEYAWRTITPPVRAAAMRPSATWWAPRARSTR